MKGYSLDLRDRVIHSWQQGKTQAWIANTFEISVSTSTIKRYIGRYRSQGHVRAKVQRYKQSTIRDDGMSSLGSWSSNWRRIPMQRWNSTSNCGVSEAGNGSVVSVSMMWRAIERAGWTRKKRQWVRVPMPKNATQSQ